MTQKYRALTDIADGSPKGIARGAVFTTENIDHFPVDCYEALSGDEGDGEPVVSATAGADARVAEAEAMALEAVTAADARVAAAEAKVAELEAKLTAKPPKGPKEGASAPAARDEF